MMMSIPLGFRRGPDRLVWHYDRKGTYSVRSGYKVTMEFKKVASSSTANNEEKWWGKLYWRLNIPNKVKIFIWRMAGIP